MRIVPLRSSLLAVVCLLAPVWPSLAQTYDYLAPVKTNGNAATANFDFRVYVPEELSAVKGVIVFSNGTGEDRRYMTSVGWVQALARTMGYAVIGSEVTWVDSWKLQNTRDNVVAMLSAAATASGRANLINAPLFPVGNSGGGIASIHVTLQNSERIVGYASSKGTDWLERWRGYGTGEWGVPAPNGWQGVPGIWASGETDTNGSVNPYDSQVQFEAWRANSAAAAFALDYNTGHSDTDGQFYDLAALTLSEAHRLRHPGTLPSSTPGNLPTLTSLTQASGWLAERAVFTAAPSSENSQCTLVTRPVWPSIAPYASYAATPVAQASWLPSELMALAYRAHTSTQATYINRLESPRQNPLQIETPARFQRFRPGDAVRITADTRDWHNVTKVEFFLNTTKLGEKTDGDWSWTLSSTPAPGVHAIILVATDTNGTRCSAYSTFFVQDIPSTGNTWTGLGGNNQMGNTANWSAGTGGWEFVENGNEDARDTKSLLLLNGASRNGQSQVSTSVMTENPTAWGVRFLPAAGTNSFSLVGSRRMHLGSAGIVNLDADNQIFNWAQLYLTSSQTWDAAAGPLQVGNGSMTRLRLGQRGSGSPRLQPENSILTITGAFDTTINAPIDGQGAILKEGSGTLVLNGANTYGDSDWYWTPAAQHETLRIHSGTVRLGASGSLASTTRAFVAAAPGATLDFNGKAITLGNLNGGGTLALGTTGSLTLTHEFVKYNDGTSTSVIEAYVIPSSFRGPITGGAPGTDALILQKGGRNLSTTLAGESNFAGRVQVQSGDLYVGHSNALGASGVGNETILASGSVLRLVGNQMILPETLTFQGQNAMQLTNERGSNTLTGRLDYPATASTTFYVRNSAASSTFTLSGGFVGGATSGNGAFLRLEPAAENAALHVSGGIEDGSAGGVTRLHVAHSGAPTGSVRLSGVSTYTGATTLVRGTLLVGSDAPANGSGALGNSLGGSLLIGRTGDTTSTDDLALFTDGPVEIGRTLEVRNLNAAGLITLGGVSPHDSVFSGQIYISSAGRDVRLAAAAGGRVNFAGRIRDEAVSSSLTVVGPGTVLLSFNGNTYDGGTTVAGGTLLLANTSGSATGTGAVTVQSGGRFGGTGTLSGGVNCQAGARFVADLVTPAASHDRLDIGGVLTLNATPIDLSSSNGLVAPGTYTLAQAASISGAPGGVIAPPGFTASAAVVGNQLQVTLVSDFTPLESWRQQYFGTPGNSGEAADQWDADGDGFANLVEFALGGDPTDSTSSPVLQSSTESNHITLTFTPRVVVGLQYTIEGSQDLSVWPEQSDITSLLATDAPYTHTDSADLNITPRRFLRLRITQP